MINWLLYLTLIFLPQILTFIQCCFLFCSLPREMCIAIKLVLPRNYADILSRPLTSTMDGTICSPRGKTRDSQPIVAQHVSCRGW